MVTDPVAVASAVFGGFSALSDAISLYRSYRQAGQTPSPQKIEDEMARSDAASIVKYDAAHELKSLIDVEDLEAIRSNIDKAKDRMRKSLVDPANDNQSRDAAVDAASSIICAELKRIRRLNGGDFPSDEYERWWQSHGCSV